LEISRKNKECKIKIERQKSGKDVYIEKKELNKCLRKITNGITACESTIEKLENKLEEISKQLESPSIKHEDGESQSIYLKFEKYGKELDEKMKEWESLHMKLNELRKKM
ncbi:MAG: ABC transporter C-terminal domain-containing protein, partial [Actinomycetota bacterium]|nr:ABC transporter C-terminal domain-containing protein [Actinomycetota bacterium]